MKRSLFLALFLSFAFTAQAQIQVYKTTISKKDVYPFTLAASDGTIEVKSNGDGGGLLLMDGESYRYRHGNGRKKDQFGFKEKHKRYLVNGRNEKLMTQYLREGKIFFPDGSWMYKYNTESGWTFEDLEGKTVAWLELESNTDTWKMALTTMQDTENTATLVKFLSIAMPMWAWHEDVMADRQGTTIGSILEIVMELSF